MSSVIEKAKAHFRAQLANDERSIDVPEWECKIFFRPMNGLQRDAIMKHVSAGNYDLAKVEALIQRARDEDGNRMFKSVHKQELMRETDPKVINRITTDMGTFDAMVDDDQMQELDLKNS